MNTIRSLIEYSAVGIEVLAVLIILAAVIFGTLRFSFNVWRAEADAFTQYKVRLGKALLLGLEFLVAADIVRTVALEQTMTSVIILGILVLIRTFLSWSLTVEVEGRLPWTAREG